MMIDSICRLLESMTSAWAAPNDCPPPSIPKLTTNCWPIPLLPVSGETLITAVGFGVAARWRISSIPEVNNLIVKTLTITTNKIVNGIKNLEEVNSLIFFENLFLFTSRTILFKAIRLDRGCQARWSAMPAQATFCCDLKEPDILVFLPAHMLFLEMPDRETN